MRKQEARRFIVSAGAGLIWLLVSAAVARPWVSDLVGRLPEMYILFAVAGIALLPGYLTGVMLVSNWLDACAGLWPLPDYDGPVTVLICARNEQKSVYETVKRVVRQDYAGPIRILCVDNGSTDGTRAELRRAREELKTDRRSVFITLCERPGKANALNQGLRLVNTRYFITVDADTFLKEDAVRLILSRIVTSGAGCVAGNLLVGKARTLVQKMQIYDYLLSIAAVKRFQGSYGSALVAQGAFSAYDTEAVRAVGGWRQEMGEDIVLTYRLLERGCRSLYEPRAVGYTLAPETLVGLCRQRTRWARGMFDGLRAVAPWRQNSFYGGYFETLNESIVYVDLAYVFGFLAGVLLCLFGYEYLVGRMTLLTFPHIVVSAWSTYLYQKRVGAVQEKHSVLGFLCFLTVFQAIQSICSLKGYWQALAGRRTVWK